MSNTATMINALRGGEFLIKDSSASNTFIPEDYTEDQKLMAQAALDFVEQEVLPKADRIDKQEEGLTVNLMNQAGELGLLGLSVPEEYGGSGSDFITSTLITEQIGGSGSFAVSMAAHTGIGTLPILYYGTEEQKKKYLPGLATGQLKGAYCLTEPGSGSDALAAKTKAVLSADGKHYILNGQKMWITNGGFADVFTVFAKIDGEKFTAFIVDANTPGVTRGEEEHKLGIKGSSTRQIFFQEAKVPVENVLGEIGKGHLIAFNILNIGRQKLCAAALGAAKRLSTISIQYATQREQFKKPIASFGAIQYKLAEQAVRIFAIESALYRASQQIKINVEELLAGGKPYHIALMGAAEEYAIECAILKVYGSEVLDYVVDECVQIHGGMGYSEEMPAARAFRDARINRIFEGTNEINRLLTVDMLLKRALKGHIDLMNPAMNVQKELMSIPDFGGDDDIPYAREKKLISNMKKAVLMTAGAAVQKLMMALENEQELLINIANMISELYICESTLLRAEKLSLNKHPLAKSADAMMQIYLFDAMMRIESEGKQAIASFAHGDELNMMQLGLKRFTKQSLINTKNLRRQIAAELINANRYCY
jgi:hypothetical protein